jgi:hypothetical protein
MTTDDTTAEAASLDFQFQCPLHIPHRVIVKEALACLKYLESGRWMLRMLDAKGSF